MSLERVTHLRMKLSFTCLCSAALALACTGRADAASATAQLGQQVTFTVSAAGTEPFTYQWRMQTGTRRAPVDILGATQPVYTIDAASRSSVGQYSVVVGNAAGSAVAPAAALTLSSDGRKPASRSAARLTNLSSRAQVGAGDQIVIAGFVVTGDAPHALLIRGVGPALASQGIHDPLSALRLTVLRGSAEVAANEDWRASAEAEQIRASAVEVGAFPLRPDAPDCAVMGAFPPGAYTVQLAGRGGASGVALVEIYELDRDSGSRLVNLSTRAQVGGGDALLITGLVIAGTEPKTLLLRAVGPGLAALQVAHPLARPSLTILDAAGRVRLANARWSTAADPTPIALAAARCGAFPLETASDDSALLATLEPGVYTCHVRSLDGGPGVALVEAYEVSTAPTP